MVFPIYFKLLAMLGQVLLLFIIVSVFASWLIKKNNNPYSNINEITAKMKVMQYTAVPGFFLHDEEPEGPVFRAVRRDLRFSAQIRTLTC